VVFQALQMSHVTLLAKTLLRTTKRLFHRRLLMVKENVLRNVDLTLLLSPFSCSPILLDLKCLLQVFF
jgi:hypothetical protein